jgi:hypothetical protein
MRERLIRQKDQVLKSCGRLNLMNVKLCGNLLVHKTLSKLRPMNLNCLFKPSIFVRKVLFQN